MHTVLCGRDSQHHSNAAFTDTLRRQQVFSRNGDIQRLPANTAPATQHPPTNHIRPLLRSPLRHLRYYACPTLHPDILLSHHISSPTAMPVRLSDFLLVRLIYSLSIYYLLLSLLLLPWPKFSARTSCPFRTPYGRQHVLDRTRTIYQFQTMKTSATRERYSL